MMNMETEVQVETIESDIITTNNDEANRIDVKPIQTPIKVSMLGKITLAFFLSAIIFKLFFGCSILFFC